MTEERYFDACVCLRQNGARDEADRLFAREAEKSLRTTFKKRIFTPFVKAINTYELVKPGDRIAVCISGGKDSMLMAKCFQELKRHNKFDFEVQFLVMDPGYSRANREMIEENARRLDIPITIFESHPAISVPACAAVIFTITPGSLAAGRLRWGTIMTM